MIYSIEDALKHVPTEVLAAELAERLSNESGSIIPLVALQNIAASCEIEMLNRTMPEHGYYKD